jgi:hypothetical protein
VRSRPAVLHREKERTPQHLLAQGEAALQGSYSRF